jgi:hypothetical protein
VFNATFSNISAIAWRPVLVVEILELMPIYMTGKKLKLELPPIN